MINMQVIQETEKRYSERKSPRDATARKIETKPLHQIDEPERVEKRMERLGVAPETARAFSVGEVVSRESVPPEGVTDIEGAAMERILGRSDLLSISYLEQGVAVSRSIGRVRIRNDRGRVVGYGTGFMVSPRLLLTNNHVLRNTQEASFSQVEFNFQDGLDGRPLSSIVFDLDPATFFITDRALDFSVVAVRDQSSGAASLASFGWSRLIEAEGKILLGEYASIIQHPNGEPKQLALRENQVIDLLDNFLHYKTDTSPGSSGSAVFNDQWEVVALHHSGVPQRDTQRRILSTSGALWTEDMGEQKVAWIANEGVRISRIVKHIKNQNLSTAQRQLRTEMFETAPPPLSLRRDEVSSPQTVNRPGEVAVSSSPSSPANMSWTFPFTISVQLTPSGVAAQVDQSGVSAGAVSPSAPVVRDERPSDDPDLREALAELEAARARPYYDETRDRKDRTTYYKGLPGTLAPANLYAALNELLTSTHANKPKYQPSRHVYPWVDLQPNLKLRSIYSAKEFDPEEFIREDFRIDQERAERFREALSVESFTGAERMAEELDLLEASLPYNCEHVVPQSWFGKREPMRGDIHHLFACESGCNSFRSNIPYFDFTDFEEAIRDECGKRETNKFEPNAGKGTVARAVLYFLLRYPGEINQIETEYDAERLKVLLAWHRANPVTEYERHRNMAIYAAQGNRNPLIDFPSWAAKIEFKLGLGK
ncbi:MAG TPA: endonuclease [Pyrinomonadaceae bacterium]|jgi:endonuclease I/V8-like Glu-specific endopeptidase